MFQLHKRFSLVTALKFWQKASTTPVIVKHGTLNKSGYVLPYLNANIWYINHNRNVYNLHGKWHKSNCDLKYVKENSNLTKLQQTRVVRNFGILTLALPRFIFLRKCLYFNANMHSSVERTTNLHLFILKLQRCGKQKINKTDVI